jgi:flagellar biosynthesis protein FlhA
MAEASQVSLLNLLSQRLRNISDSDAMMGIAVVAILSVMLLPLSGPILDVFLSINISFAMVILLTAIYTLKPLDFIIYPSLLLITTLFRLALNVASTRLVLLHGHEGTAAAGHIIQAFGQFVVGGNYVVGLVIFVILVIVNFVVITKGTERISEVAARFTLDAMPGKQMSIDADLNAGLINEAEARRRRELIAREADFYGTMDGASKFVRGDAVAGIIITFINIVGGIAIGVIMKGMPLREALQTYTILTVGDGLVSQIPALIISTSAGILVSRAETEMGLGRSFVKQFRFQPRPIAIAGLVLYGLALVPGFPALPLFLVGSGLIGTGWHLMKRAKKAPEKPEEPTPSEPQPTPQREIPELPPPVEPLQLEVGYGLIPLIDESQGGDMLQRIKAIRKQLALERGIVVPPLHIRDNLQLRPMEYQLLLKGAVVGKYELMAGHLLALSPEEEKPEIKGIPTTDPAFGIPALWIPESKRDEAIKAGYTLIDHSTIMATHLTELFKKYADQLLSRQIVQQLLDHLAESQPRLVEELVPNLLNVGTIQRVLQNLVREQVSIRDLQTICETLADYAHVTKDPDTLTEYVRQALGRTITQPYETEDGKLHVITLHPLLEDKLKKGIQKTDQGTFISLEPGFLHRFVQQVNSEVRKVIQQGFHPVILCSAAIRRHVRRILERFIPDVVVISHNELVGPVEIKSIGMVRLSDED